jgi:DNA-binding transcriptional ArsR family regulator
VQEEENQQRTDNLLMELKKEVADLRDELRAMSDAIISERIRSVERAVVQSHLELYSTGTEDLLKEAARNCLDEECQKQQDCEERFIDSINVLSRACKEKELEEAFSKIDSELNRIERVIEINKGKPCEICYEKLKELLTRQRNNIKSIIKFEPNRTDIPDKFKIDASRLVEEVLKPLSHPTRLEILASLRKGGVSFKELSESTGMKGGHLIFHLDQLMSSSLIGQNGRKGIYVITSKGIKIMDRLLSLPVYE